MILCWRANLEKSLRWFSYLSSPFCPHSTHSNVIVDGIGFTFFSWHRSNVSMFRYLFGNNHKSSRFTFSLFRSSSFPCHNSIRRSARLRRVFAQTANHFNTNDRNRWCTRHFWKNVSLNHYIAYDIQRKLFQHFFAVNVTTRPRRSQTSCLRHQINVRLRCNCSSRCRLGRCCCCCCCNTLKVALRTIYHLSLSLSMSLCH